MAIRRKRGPDGRLYSREEYKAKFESEATPTEETVTTVTTPEKVARKNKPSVQEKSTATEKDSAPSIILSYVDSNGRRVTTTFQCDTVKLTQNRDQTFGRSGSKTTLDIYIEASVIEVI